MGKMGWNSPDSVHSSAITPTQGYFPCPSVWKNCRFMINKCMNFCSSFCLSIIKNSLLPSLYSHSSRTLTALILLESPSSILPLPIRSTSSTLINFPTSWREIKPIPILPKSLSETNQQESKTLRNSPAVELQSVPIKSRKSSFHEITQSSRKYTASVFVKCKTVK